MKIVKSKEKHEMSAVAGHERGWDWIGWLPLILLPGVAFTFRSAMSGWGFMWALAFAMCVGAKWLTWWQARKVGTQVWRHWAYLFAWPGMDARAFLDERQTAAKPSIWEWSVVVLEIAFGVVMTWELARLVPASQSLIRGWIGFAGRFCMVHFGILHLLALGWQRMGINAEPLMHAPIMATSLAEFWGQRWNTAFHLLAHDLVFRPLRRRVGVIVAMMAVFLVSGIIHDLLISLPARGGYGLPTIYFLIQGIGLLIERSAAGKALGLRRGFTGWLFTLAVTAGPVFWLFHPLFINRVIVPFMQAIHAL